MQREVGLERLEPQRDVADAPLELPDASRVAGNLPAKLRLALPVRRDPSLQRRDLRVDLVLLRGVVSERRRGEGEQQDECGRDSAHVI